MGPLTTFWVSYGLEYHLQLSIPEGFYVSFSPATQLCELCARSHSHPRRTVTSLMSLRVVRAGGGRSVHVMLRPAAVRSGTW